MKFGLDQKFEFKNISNFTAKLWYGSQQKLPKILSILHGMMPWMKVNKIQ
jgi:hypothetical protein